MDENLLLELLEQKEESDWIDFKQKLKLYDSGGKLNQKARDELIKDILGLANGNSSIIRKTKYLIVGADDKKFDSSGMRVLFDVNYQVPSKSDITKWVNSACTPSVVGIDTYSLPVKGNNVYGIEIPPTFELHEITRELNAKGKFSKFTVFMRQDEHTVPASVKDGVTIQELKYLHRQEVLNPSAIRFGAILGAIIAFLFWSSGYSATYVANGKFEFVIKLLPLVIGAFLGAEAGWIIRDWNSLRYDWPYFPRGKKIRVIVGAMIPFCFILLFWHITKI